MIKGASGRGLNLLPGATGGKSEGLFRGDDDHGFVAHIVELLGGVAAFL